MARAAGELSSRLQQQNRSLTADRTGPLQLKAQRQAAHRERLHPLIGMVAHPTRQSGRI
jgi:hypothetical protein